MRELAVYAGLFALTACGRHIEAPQDGGAEAVDEGPRVTTFACGTTECIVGKHACCTTSTACVAFDGGVCGADDAGRDGGAGSVLACLSSSNCTRDHVCCYRPDVGSSCKKGCADGTVLCSLKEEDSCENGDCTAFGAGAPNAPPGPPSPALGQCESRSGPGGVDGRQLPP